MRKRRLLKDILEDAATALDGNVLLQDLVEEIREYLDNSPLFRVDYAMPVFSRIHTYSDDKGKEVTTKFRVTRKVFAFSSTMNNWYHGWFSLNIKTNEIIFHCSDFNYKGVIVHDFLLWMENIPFPNRYTNPIRHDNETKNAYISASKEAKDIRKQAGKKELAEG